MGSKKSILKIIAAAVFMILGVQQSVFAAYGRDAQAKTGSRSQRSRSATGAKKSKRTQQVRGARKTGARGAIGTSAFDEDLKRMNEAIAAERLVQKQVDALTEKLDELTALDKGLKAHCEQLENEYTRLGGPDLLFKDVYDADGYMYADIENDYRNYLILQDKTVEKEKRNWQIVVDEIMVSIAAFEWRIAVVKKMKEMGREIAVEKEGVSVTEWSSQLVALPSHAGYVIFDEQKVLQELGVGQEMGARASRGRGVVRAKGRAGKSGKKLTRAPRKKAQTNRQGRKKMGIQKPVYSIGDTIDQSIAYRSAIGQEIDLLHKQSEKLAAQAQQLKQEFEALNGDEYMNMYSFTEQSVVYRTLMAVAVQSAQIRADKWRSRIAEMQQKIMIWKKIQQIRGY